MPLDFTGLLLLSGSFNMFRMFWLVLTLIEIRRVPNRDNIAGFSFEEKCWVFVFARNGGISTR